MRNYLLIAICFFSLASVSCRWRSIKGNGQIGTETRNERNFKGVKTAGSFDVYFSQAGENEIRIEADENLLKYIITDVENGMLIVKHKNGINLRPSRDIKIFVKAPDCKELTLAGSGNIIAETNIQTSEKLNLKIAGSGDIKMKEIDAPAVTIKIAGSGKVEGRGSTKDLNINVAGSGDVKVGELKAENAEIHIAGSGNVWVYASMVLDVRVAGGGDIHYYGNPASIKSKMAGSGNLIKE